jgi:hypothetical protein
MTWDLILDIHSFIDLTENLYLLTGYEGNSKFIDPEIPTIARDEAEGNSWHRVVNKLTIPWVYIYDENRLTATISLLVSCEGIIRPAVKCFGTRMIY